ncbi:MAG: multidrug ABC transporter ATP-binding protein, partial [Perlucidibaca sp.]
MMFAWFERRLNPFPPEEPSEPPRTLLAFCLHYTRGAWPWLISAALLMATIAVAEVWLFRFLGDIVNWLSQQDRATFLQMQGRQLASMAAVIIG